MRAGEMNRRIELQRFKTGQPEQDDTGDTTPAELADANWTTVIRCWAKRSSNQGREFFAARQEQAEVTHVFECRYIRGVTTRMRLREVVEGVTKVYDIKSAVDPDGRRRRTIIAVQELT